MLEGREQGDVHTVGAYYYICFYVVPIPEYGLWPGRSIPFILFHLLTHDDGHPNISCLLQEDLV